MSTHRRFRTGVACLELLQRTELGCRKLNWGCVPSAVYNSIHSLHVKSTCKYFFDTQSHIHTKTRVKRRNEGPGISVTGMTLYSSITDVAFCFAPGGDEGALRGFLRAVTPRLHVRPRPTRPACAPQPTTKKGPWPAGWAGVSGRARVL